MFLDEYHKSIENENKKRSNSLQSDILSQYDYKSVFSILLIIYTIRLQCDIDSSTKK